MRNPTEELLIGWLLFFTGLAIILSVACSSPADPETITIYETVHDTVYTETVGSSISLSPMATGLWEMDDDGNEILLAYIRGVGVNVTETVVDGVAVEFALTTDRGRKEILSKTVGYFITEEATSKYVPNSPFPFEIEHSLEPDSAYYIYVSADTLRNVIGAYWWIRVISGDGLSKTAWNYGGEM